MKFNCACKINNEVFGELQQHLKDLSESFQIHCCWKAGSALHLEYRLDEFAAKHSCQFCSMYKAADPANEKKCIAHDYYTLTASLAESQDAFEARCPAGAMELVIPFHQHDICLGAVLCGPYRKPSDPANEMLTELSGTRLKSLTNIIRNLLRNTIGLAYADKMPEMTDQRLLNAVNFIRRNFQHRITVDEAAAKANMSRSRFLHVFPQSCGKTFGEYLRELRVQESCKLLKRADMTIAAVALAAGFCSQSHFTSVFRQVMKITPKVYRQQHIDKSGKQPPADNF